MKLYLKKDEKVKKELITKFGDKVKCSYKKVYMKNKKILFDTSSIKPDKVKELKIEEFLEVNFFNKDIFDRNEIEVYDYIKSKYDVVVICKISKKFTDLHKVSSTKDFKRDL